ncbi:hypothetical protein QCE73_08920 [Caballeronia sp. LZ029]|uniref:hypothetical protein n=1 Tax=Caballeronia sp. LZ029 TaxID=3038564 RepID=UPI00285ED5A3|nr:hypothetical protein [Caballeronia sp. LZ029]MDR5743275.1 hypothetical protein [Caballeronia sp. LZ029]
MSDFEAMASRLYGGSTPTTPQAQTVMQGEAAPIENRLYPDAAPSPQAAPQPAAEPAAIESETASEKPQESAPQAEQTATEPGKPELPDAIRELRDDPTRRMFSPQGTFASVPLEDAMANVAADPEVKAAVAHEFREIFEDIGASPQDAHELVTAARAFTAEPVTPERDASNVNSAIDALNRQYGKDAKSALATAQAMINRDPRLAQMLDRTRLGNDPKTVLKIVALARSNRGRR